MTYKRYILVTGGAGFVGSWMAKRMISDPENFVVIVDNLLTGSLRRLPSKEMSNWRFVKGDVNNYDDGLIRSTSQSFDGENKFKWSYFAASGTANYANSEVLCEVD